LMLVLFYLFFYVCEFNPEVFVFFLIFFFFNLPYGTLAASWP